MSSPGEGLLPEEAAAGHTEAVDTNATPPMQPEEDAAQKVLDRKARRAARKAATQERARELAIQRTMYMTEFSGLSCGWKAPFAQPRLAVAAGGRREPFSVTTPQAPRRSLGLLGPVESTYIGTYKGGGLENFIPPVKNNSRNLSRVPLGSLYGQSSRDFHAGIERERMKQDMLNTARRMEQEVLDGTALQPGRKLDLTSNVSIASLGDPRAASVVLGVSLPSSHWTTESRIAWNGDVHARTFADKYLIGPDPKGAKDKQRKLLSSAL
mmetsp:Transcript_63431/g.151342  ORF Transcript_63431/g.151342 Transcript_63431/m.151342 type:complete len:268 (+) Transcript_63431:92-895(+)